MVIEKSGWGKRKLGKDRAWVLQPIAASLTYVATVVEVEVNDQGDIRIPRVDCVVERGLVVNPRSRKRSSKARPYSEPVWPAAGKSRPRTGRLSNRISTAYPVARINEAPYQTNVYLVESDAPPAGVGEPGVPPFIPALCNAIYVATGEADS